VVKHARARRVAIILSLQGDEVRLCVEDDGCGFDPEAVPRRLGGGLGLVSMRERAEALRGTFTVDSRPERGTRVKVGLPREGAWR
jgi:signal transduction histidine kinase